MRAASVSSSQDRHDSHDEVEDGRHLFMEEYAVEWDGPGSPAPKIRILLLAEVDLSSAARVVDWAITRGVVFDLCAVCGDFLARPEGWEVNAQTEEQLSSEEGEMSAIVAQLESTVCRVVYIPGPMDPVIPDNYLARKLGGVSIRSAFEPKPSGAVGKPIPPRSPSHGDGGEGGAEERARMPQWTDDDHLYSGGSKLLQLTPTSKNLYARTLRLAPGLSAAGFTEYPHSVWHSFRRSEDSPPSEPQFYVGATDTPSVGSGYGPAAGGGGGEEEGESVAARAAPGNATRGIGKGLVVDDMLNEDNFACLAMACRDQREVASEASRVEGCGGRKAVRQRPAESVILLTRMGGVPPPPRPRAIVDGTPSSSASSPSKSKYSARLANAGAVSTITEPTAAPSLAAPAAPHAAATGSTARGDDADSAIDPGASNIPRPFEENNEATQRGAGAASRLRKLWVQEASHTAAGAGIGGSSDDSGGGSNCRKRRSLLLHACAGPGSLRAVREVVALRSLGGGLEAVPLTPPPGSDAGEGMNVGGMACRIGDLTVAALGSLREDGAFCIVELDVPRAAVPDADKEKEEKAAAPPPPRRGDQRGRGWNVAEVKFLCLERQAAGMRSEPRARDGTFVQNYD